MVKIIILSILLVVITSCTPSHNYVHNVELTESELIYSDSVNLFSISDFNIYENTLIFMCIDQDEIFSFLDLDAKKLIKFGAKGRATNEFIQVSNKFRIHDSYLVVNDFGRKTVFCIPIKKILYNDSARVEFFKYPYSRNFRPKDFIITDYHKVGIGSFSDSMLGVLDLNDNISNITIPYLFDGEKIEGIYKGSIYQTLIQKQPDGNKFVVSILSSDLFAIYESFDIGIKTIFKSIGGNIPVLKEKAGDFINYAIDYKKSLAGYTNLYATKDCIYMGYSDLPYEKYANAGTIKKIHCYNWEGEQICIYHLPEEISRFCIKKDFIYALKEDRDCTKIYRIKLNLREL